MALSQTRGVNAPPFVSLKRAAELMLDGHPVIFPTETFFALGSRALDADATARGGAVSSSRVINAAASASQSVHIRLDCSEGTENILSSVLNYLTLNSYTLSPERES